MAGHADKQRFILLATHHEWCSRNVQDRGLIPEKEGRVCGGQIEKKKSGRASSCLLTVPRVIVILGRQGLAFTFRSAACTPSQVFYLWSDVEWGDIEKDRDSEIVYERQRESEKEETGARKRNVY